MVGALGVNQALLFTAVFALGAALAGFGGALQVAREPANLATDLTAISDAFVVVVVGGMGSISGAYLGRRHHRRGQSHLHRHRRGRFRLHQREFLQADAGRRIPGDGGGADRAALRLARPRASAVRSIAEPEDPIRPATPALKALGVVVLALLLCLPLLAQSSPYLLILGIDVLIAVIFAASPAFHRRARRHAFVRPRRLFRPRRLWRGAAGEMARPCRWASRSSPRLWSRLPARCCSAGSRCGCPASISPC